MQDLKTEAFLRRGKWKFIYERGVPLSEIDIDGSLENPGRLDHRLEEDRVVDYTLHMEAGDEFPAVVLLKRPEQKHLVATGMHRLAAARRCTKPPRKTHAAYVVREADLYRQEVLIRQLNTLEGRGYTREDKLAQILALHERYPEHTIPDYAREWRVAATTIRDALRVGKLNREAAEWELPGYRAISNTTKLALGSITNEPCRRAATDCILTWRLKGDEATLFAKEVAAAAKKTESAGIRVVQGKHKAKTDDNARGKARHGKTSTSRASRFVGTCKTLMRQVPNGVATLHLAALTDISSARLAVEETIELLKAVVQEFDRVQSHAGAWGNGASKHRPESDDARP